MIIDEEKLYGLYAYYINPETGQKIKDFDNHGEPIETGSKDYLEKQARAYENNWNVNSEGNTYKFYVKYLGNTSWAESLEENLDEYTLRDKLEELGFNDISKLVDEYSSCVTCEECDKVRDTIYRKLKTIKEDEMSRDLFLDVCRYFDIDFDDYELTTNESFNDDMKFLADDEIEAIDGYEKIINKVKDKHVVKQLKHIQDEEEAHLNYLNKVQDDKSIDYEEHIEEGLEKDYSDIELIDRFDFENKGARGLPGINNIKGFIDALNKVGKDEFKCRTTTFGKNISDNDIKDAWMDINRNGWSIGRAWDSSLSGFNEIYICKKIKDINESIDEEVIEETGEYKIVKTNSISYRTKNGVTVGKPIKREIYQVYFRTQDYNPAVNRWMNKGWSNSTAEFKTVEDARAFVKKYGKTLKDDELNEELESSLFWNLRDLSDSIFGVGNLVIDGDIIRPLSYSELANKFAVSIEHADKGDFKTKEELLDFAKKTGAEKIMFFFMPGENYSGEYSFLYSDEDKVRDIWKKYKQYAYAMYDEDGEYHEITESLEEECCNVEEDIEKHDVLNPFIFDENNEMNSEVREKLLEIAQHFVDEVHEDELDLDVKDIVLIGSNANYNYTKDSDLDVHIIASSKPDCNKKHLDKIYQAYKAMFNKNYDITIHGIPTEIYVEMDDVNARSGGIYSIKDGKWLKQPKQFEVPDIDYDAFYQEFKKWEDRYTDLVDNIDEYENASEEVEKYIDDIYEARQEGITNNGEFDTLNLVFKEVRNRGYLDNLKELKRELESKELSLESIDK